ncbi:DUF461 domain-containing protein [Streptomyces sp. NPDC006879]|uniref:DUF461 domain-containing protein n=1 Tax=Streptomyces sp. NPDC006879 TaxID=3364767 RepID=UPI0036BD0200
MSRSLRRGALAAVAIVFSIASLSACGAGLNAQTMEVKPDNPEVTVGDVKIQNALVITQPEASAEGPAVVSATIFNAGDSAETLENIKLDGGPGTIKLTAAQGSGPVTVPAGGSVVLGGKGNASATIQGGRESVKDGDAQKLTFGLSKTGDVAINAFVVPAKGYFDSWGPTERPAPTATPSASASTTPAGEGEHGAEGEDAEHESGH